MVALPSSLRVKLGRLVVDGVWNGLARSSRFHPRARRALREIRLDRDLAYAPPGDPAHRLDVYRPAEQDGPLPAVVYFHGGGFRILSKDTHWLFGVMFARRGYAVFNVSYRLAPRHPFPAAAEDAFAALAWVKDNAARFGVDAERLVLAGESAGGNLVCDAVIASCWERPEPWARRLFDLDLQPRAAAPICGMLQVSDAARFTRRRPSLPRWVADRLEEVSESYLAGVDGAAAELADPLLILERAAPPARPLPPFFCAAGTRDPLLDDTRRLARALERLGVPHEARYYPGGVHAFNALLWQDIARRCWADELAFLARHVGQR